MASPCCLDTAKTTCRLQIFKPDGFTVPFVPGVCGFCIFGGIFLMGNAGGAALWRFAIVIGVCIVSFYLLNPIPAA